MRCSSTFAVFVATVLVATSVQAADYWVDRADPQASDGNPGSETLPWRTIQHGVDQARAGDTVWIKAGTYEEAVRMEASGSDGAWITLAAAPGEVVTIDGSNVVLEEWVGLLTLTAVSYVRVQGLRVEHVSGYPTSVGIQVEDSSHIVIAGNRTEDTASSGILVWGSSEVVIEDNEVVQACAIGASGENECLTVGGSTGVDVRRNHVHHGSTVRGEGIDVKDGSSDARIYDNHVHDVMHVGIYVDAWDKPTHNIQVYRNLVHDIQGDAFATGSEQGGLLSNITFANNIAYDCLWVGINVHNCCIDSHPLDGITIVNNTLVANGIGQWGGGIMVENDQASDLVIRNNLVAGNLSFQIALETPATSGITVDHNLIHGFRGYEGETRGSDFQEGDPLFVDGPGHDYHLLAGSPALDTGSPALAPDDDYDGTARPQGAGFDIGAFERATGPTCSVTCSATVPATATAGEAVQLQATATATGCGTAPSYAWDLGDGTTTTGQSPVHTWATADTYDWSMTATAGTGTCQASGTITVSEGCTPPQITGEPEDQVVSPGDTATLTVTATGTAPLSFQWYQGQAGTTSTPVAGASSSSLTTPPLSQTTRYWVQVINACGSADSTTVTVTVQDEGQTWHYAIAAVAHNPGLGGTMWRSDVVVVNPGDAEVDITATFHPTQGADMEETTSVPARGLVEWRNVLESGFGVDPSTSLSGSLALAASGPLVVTCRTFNQTEVGTYGQYLPAASSSYVLRKGDTGFLGQVRESDEFRTNVGALNLGQGQAVVRLTLVTAKGTETGSPVSMTLAPGEWQQITNIVDTAGAGLEIGYAVLEVLSGEVWAYASVVDNATGDPTTIPLLVAND